MRKIKLTNGEYSLVDEVKGLLHDKSAWRKDARGYVVRYIKKGGRRTIISLHREIMGDPDGMFVDHINHNKLDNRRINLRICTKEENCRNRRANYKGSSKFKGVSRRKDCARWSSNLATFKNGVRTRYYLGSYKTEIEAALAYNKKAKELFGEFALLNNIK